ncbi:MAG: Fe-S cluster assembly protein SufD [bacterium]|nr:Fe-S cluster assembly protein SufD [bacterium]
MSDSTMKQNPEFLINEMTPHLHRGPDWLKAMRRSDRLGFNEAELPPRGIHLWRYTDPIRFMMDIDTATDADFTGALDAVVKAEAEHVKEGRLAALVTDRGGRDIDVQISPAGLPQGVIIGSLSDASESNFDLVKEHLYQMINRKSGKFEAMNGALWNDGIFIYVPDNVVIEKPVHLFREAGGENSATFPRLLVIVGRNAEVTLIDEYGGGSPDRNKGISFSNGAVELFGSEDSRTRYVSLQRYAPAMNSYFTHRAKLKQNATMLTIPLVFGGELCKQSFGVELAGAGADSKMYGLLFGSNRQHFDNHTLHHHSAGKSTSDIDFKVVLKDRALSAYTGLIRIDNKARTCEAYQENRNLLLNPGTRAETIPELEILNEDVSCSHGATLGPIDEESIFYLKSRGIERNEAVRMIVGGFVQSTFKLVPEDLKDRLSDFVATRLETI